MRNHTSGSWHHGWALWSIVWCWSVTLINIRHWSCRGIDLIFSSLHAKFGALEVRTIVNVRGWKHLSILLISWRVDILYIIKITNHRVRHHLWHFIHVTVWCHYSWWQVIFLFGCQTLLKRALLDRTLFHRTMLGRLSLVFERWVGDVFLDGISQLAFVWLSKVLHSTLQVRAYFGVITVSMELLYATLLRLNCVDATIR